MALADGKTEYHKRRHGAEFCPCGNVLEKRAPAQADHVYVGQDRDQQQSKHVRSCDRDSEKRKYDVLLRDEGKYVSGVSRRCDGERRDRAAVGYRKQHPAIKKGDEIS